MRCRVLVSLLGIAFALVLIVQPVALAADLYQWRDAKGTLHFGSHPPVNGAYQQLKKLSSHYSPAPDPVTALPATSKPTQQQDHRADIPEPVSPDKSWFQVPLAGILSPRQQKELRQRGITLHPRQSVSILFADDVY